MPVKKGEEYVEVVGDGEQGREVVERSVMKEKRDLKVRPFTEWI
jgi:hypothetical protein